MRICYIAHASNLTGASRSMINLICELKKVGIKPYVILPKNGIIEDELRKNNIKYTIIKSYATLNKVDKKVNIIKYFVKKIINYFAIKKIIKIIKKEQIEIVHINSLISYVGAAAAYKAGIKYIWHIREFLEEDHNFKIINKREYKKLMKNASAKITISKTIFKKFSNIYDNNKMYIVYNGIPVNDYITSDRQQIDFSKDINACIIGRISEGKGQLHAIKAIEYVKRTYKNKKCKLYIIGSPEDDQAYNKQIHEYVAEKSLDNEVIFIPFTKDLKKYRHECPINFVCSKKEAFGRVTIEGMLSNQLIIATNTGANPELINDGITGFLYEENNIKSLFNKISIVIENQNKVKEIIKNANKYAIENYSIKNTAEGVYKIYQSISKKK